MELTDIDRVRFQERIYDHAREEMIVHIKYRRITAVTAATFSVGALVWLLTEGAAVLSVLPYLSVAPWIFLALGAGSIEATNSKIRAHNCFLRKIEERYELDSTFLGFEGHYASYMKKSQAPFLVSEKIWLRTFLIAVGVLEIFFLYAEQ